MYSITFILVQPPARPARRSVAPLLEGLHIRSVGHLPAMEFQYISGMKQIHDVYDCYQYIPILHVFVPTGCQSMKQLLCVLQSFNGVDGLESSSPAVKKRHQPLVVHPGCLMSTQNFVKNRSAAWPHPALPSALYCHSFHICPK